MLFRALWYQKNENFVPYLRFGPLLAFRYDIGNIDAIFGVQVIKFRHVFKGEAKLKGDVGLESDLQFGIGLKIGWLLIWFVNKQI